MFVPLWVLFLVSGLLMAICTVVWGIRSGQFEDQDRARYLPLAGLTAEEIDAKPATKHRAETIAGSVLILVGLSALSAGMWLALRHL